MKKESVILGCAGMFSSTSKEYHLHKVLARLHVKQYIQFCCKIAAFKSEVLQINSIEEAQVKPEKQLL